ncbi:WD40 repeat domain-containing protein [Azorhizobium doebereinerae]|uniref:WD40 repeat domain-containing protein n=1 Tax=Azorhizobium doebereinerae TaxID=281091 RepID=UPI000409C26D|nr:WD40 repeat domain-containing protein [Azorhizobium doebereinerae]
MSSAPSSLTDKVRTFSFDGGIAAACFLKSTAVLVGDTGAAMMVNGAETKAVALHGGAALDVRGDGKRLVSGGDDGRVVELTANGEVQVLAEHKGRWIDRVALGPDGAVAYSAGKTAHFRPVKGEARSLEVASTVGGLAFAPKGTRIAVAHYGGVTFWFPNALDAKPDMFGWKGSHLGVAISPDGRFLVTTMQEAALHGWRISDGGHMRMTGYPARVKSFAFTADGKWLATSGSSEVILWPFASKEGPMGKQPSMVAPSSTARVSVVACHPKDPVLAVGYDDGMVLMARIPDGAEILLRAPDGAAVTAAGWRADGGAVTFGTASGSAGVLEF